MDTGDSFNVPSKDPDANSVTFLLISALLLPTLVLGLVVVVGSRLMAVSWIVVRVASEVGMSAPVRSGTVTGLLVLRG